MGTALRSCCSMARSAPSRAASLGCCRSSRATDGKTLMTMVQRGFPSAELRDEHRAGLTNAFARLEQAIEERASPLRQIRARPQTRKETPEMGNVVIDMSMSLDGFITEPNEGVGNPLGDDPGRLHDWMFDAKTETDAAILDEIYASTGAVLIGKRMFDVGFKPWGDPPPFGMPVFVVTHEARDPLPMQGGTTYTFVSDGIESGLAQARAAAGDKNVGIWG